MSHIRIKAKIYLSITSVLLAITLLSGAILSSPRAFAEDITISVVIPVSCTLSIGAHTAHSAYVAPGIYKTDIGESTFQTFCNDENGFAIYAVGATGNTYGNNKLVHKDNSAKYIETGTATSGDNSAWAMKITAVEVTDFTPTIADGSDGDSYSAYHAVPSSYEEIASFSASTAANNDGVSIKTTYAVYANRVQTAGDYQGKVKYVIVHPNSAAAPANTVGDAPIAYMQNWDGCSSIAVGDTVTLYDERDDQAYTVGKFYMDSERTAANARCWLMENLNLGAEPLLASKLDSSNTNLSSGSDIDKDTFEGWIKSSGTSDYEEPEIIPVAGRDSSRNIYGVLYNYAAASAGTIIDSSNNSNAANDLCPAGWQLPSGAEYSQLMTGFGGLTTTMDASTTPAGATMSNIIQNELKLPLAGNFSNSTPTGQGSSGNYWSRTYSDSTAMYTLSMNASNVYPSSAGDRSHGLSIRCVAQ